MFELYGLSENGIHNYVVSYANYYEHMITSDGIFIS